MDWKVLAVVGIGVAAVASASGKSAGAKAPPAGGLPPATLAQLKDLLEACKVQAAFVVTGREPYGVKWEAAVAAYDAASDLYEQGEDDSFELAVAAMDAMLPPGCDWGLLSETFSSEELGDSELYDVWQAADEIAHKVIDDVPVDVYELKGMFCAQGWSYQDTEWGMMCVRNKEATVDLPDIPAQPGDQPVEPIEAGFNPGSGVPGTVDP